MTCRLQGLSLGHCRDAAVSLQALAKLYRAGRSGPRQVKPDGRTDQKIFRLEDGRWIWMDLDGFDLCDIVSKRKRSQKVQQMHQTDAKQVCCDPPIFCFDFAQMSSLDVMISGTIGWPCPVFASMLPFHVLQTIQATKWAPLRF